MTLHYATIEQNSVNVKEKYEIKNNLTELISRDSNNQLFATGNVEKSFESINVKSTTF